MLELQYVRVCFGRLFFSLNLFFFIDNQTIFSNNSNKFVTMSDYIQNQNSFLEMIADEDHVSLLRS
jgi:hypothetical protein